MQLMTLNKFITIPVYIPEFRFIMYIKVNKLYFKGLNYLIGHLYAIRHSYSRMCTKLSQASARKEWLQDFNYAKETLLTFVIETIKTHQSYICGTHSSDSIATN